MLASTSQRGTPAYAGSLERDCCLCMQGKKLTFLHVFHHAWVVVMAFWWLEAAQSLQQIALLTNTAIHVLMYYYYFMCSIKRPPRWKKLVTQAQIIQFVFR